MPGDVKESEGDREVGATPGPFRQQPQLPQIPQMAAGVRDRARIEMTANLNDDEYVKGIAIESFRLIYNESAAVRMAIRSTKRIMEAELGHVGADSKHPSWRAGRPDYASIQSLLETDNAGGEVREQIMHYARVVCCSQRVDSHGTDAERDSWGSYLDEYFTLDKYDADSRLSSSEGLWGSD